MNGGTTIDLYVTVRRCRRSTSQISNFNKCGRGRMSQREKGETGGMVERGYGNPPWGGELYYHLDSMTRSERST